MARYTEAHKRATQKYQQTLKNIGIRIKPDEYERIKNHVDNLDVSLREFVLEAINEKIERTK